MSDYARKGEWLETSEALEALAIPERLLGKLARTDGIRRSGGKLRLRLFPRAEAGFEPEWADLVPLYEDDFVLVVSKPAGMPVHPAERGGKGSLANAVAAYYESTGQAVAVRHIHRLDAETTGPVLYAKNAWAQAMLDADMRDKRIGRVYVAVVSGIPAKAQGTVDAAIGKDRHHAGRRRVSRTGDRAVTHFEAIRTFKEANASLLRLKLETGRTHQIRVHMKHLGLPIYGDAMYGGKRTPFLARQALHGESVSFVHPWTREAFAVEAPMPGDMAALIASLGN